MLFYTIAEFKPKASEIVRKVKETGTDALITVNGKPMVFLSPANEEDIQLSRSPQVRDRVKRAMKERTGGKIIYPGKKAAGAK